MKLTDFKMDLPSYVRALMERLEHNGYEAFVVGGSVRDAMLGKTPNDYDITTSAKPNEILEVFKNFRCIETGLKHGTVTVMSDGNNVEITTYRVDGEYADNRHPKEVFFTTDINDDLSRRDFTVNAMAYSIESGVVDPFGGREHLLYGKIVCVGNPYDRFHEDGLRILRALRFASVLSFEIEKETAERIISEKKLLANISKERIYAELSKLIIGKGAGDILKRYRCVIEECCPIYGTDEEYIARIDALVRTDVRVCSRYAVLFGSEEKVREAMRVLKTDSKTRERAQKLAKYMYDDLSLDKQEIKKMISCVGFDLFVELCDIRRAFGDQNADSAIKASEEIRESGECVFIKDLKISGEDICKLGYTGKMVGELLGELLCDVIEERVQNDSKQLIERVRLKKGEKLYE